jgi:plastocyanin
LSISGKDLVGNNEQGYIEWWHNIPELTDRDVVGGVIDIRADDESSFTGHIAWEIRGRWTIGEAQLFCPGERTYFFGGRLLSGLTGTDMFPEGTKLRINFSKAGIQGTTGEKGATGNPAVFIDSFSTTIPDVVVKGSASHSLLGESISLTYAGRIAPITGGIYLTDPSKGTGFPVYFPTAAFDTVTFGNQTITAGIGETVTLRIVVTGNGGGFDVHDHTVTIGNEVRWGKTDLVSLTAGDIQAFLSNTLAKNDLENEFRITMTNGEYIYWCHPIRLGRSYQSINNGAYGGMSLQGERDLTGSPTVAYTNVNGYEESFYVYRSENTFRVSNLPVRTASAQ